MTSKTIRHHGRSFRVRGSRRYNGREYLLLHPLGDNGRSHLVFDRQAGPGGSLRSLHVVDRRNRDRLAVLTRLANDSEASGLPVVIDSGECHEGLFFVLKWNPGVDLLRFVERRDQRKVPVATVCEAFRYYRGLAHTLHHLSRRNIVHGDIAPQNLVISGRPNRLSLIDFGSAWLAESTSVRSVRDGATPGFRSPEQILGMRAIDWRSDQFSATAVLYWMMGRTRPYDGLSGAAALPENADIAVAGPGAPSALGPPAAERVCPDHAKLPREVWAAIDRVTLRALALNRDERYSTFAEWLKAVDQVEDVFRDYSRLTPWDRMTLGAINGIRGVLQRLSGTSPRRNSL